MNSGRSNNLILKYLRLNHLVAKILGFENLTLWQRLNSFSYLMSKSELYQDFIMYIIITQH